MAKDKLDVDKAKEFVTKHLKDITDPAQVKFRSILKALKGEFGRGMFIPQLSAMVRSIRPDLTKPARKVARRRRGAKPGPKPGKKYAKRAGRPAASNGSFLVKFGRKLSLAGSRDRVQAAIDKLVAAGKSLGRLKVYALSPVGVTTKVTIE